MTRSPGDAQVATFTSGSTMRHVIVMAGTGSIGLVSIFIVDVFNLFYISLLGVEELAAAIGFASTLLFFTISVAIGFTVACGALVARCLGRGDREEAARMGGASLVFMGVATSLLTIAIWPFLHDLVALMGARGQTLALSTRFLQIVFPSTPILALGMCTTGILRGVADARRAMYVTLGSAFAAAILDPLLIFGLGLGLDGAAISTVLVRFVMVAIGIHGAHRIHGLVRLPDLARLGQAARPFFSIGLPAALTQLATPVGNAYVTIEMAAFGDRPLPAGRLSDASSRLPSVSSSPFPARSGRYSAEFRSAPLRSHRLDDARQPYRHHRLCGDRLGTAGAVRGPVASLFGAVGLSRELIIFFCHFAAGSFLFNGALFVASAAFNNLGYPTYSTLFNWGRSTLGVIPFVWVGASMFGAKGVLAGWGLGAVVFGIASMVVCFRTVAGIARRQSLPEDPLPALPPAANSPFSTGKASTL